MLCACLFTTSGSVVLWSLSHSQKETFMRGVVVHHEHRIGYIVIRDQIGEFTVAELLGMTSRRGTSYPVNSTISVAKLSLTRLRKKKLKCLFRATACLNSNQFS